MADIIMTGYIGAVTIAGVAAEYRDELIKKLPHGLVDRAAEYMEALEGSLSECSPDTSFVKEDDIVLPVGEGGIFRALSGISSITKKGFVVNLRDINITQETVEICEIYDVNPYKLYSPGCCLYVSSQGMSLLRALRDKGYTADIIGYTTSDNDKKVVNGDETRYLETRFEDEIKKIKRQL